MTKSSKRGKKLLLEIALGTISKITPEKLFKDQFKPITKRKPKGRVFIFSIGKAASGMARAAMKYLHKFHPTIFLADTGHPFPTPAGLKKTERILRISKTLNSEDISVVLVSGGGSSMFVAPAMGVTLEEKIKLTQQLLKSSATINEINIVRKHLSQVKGGQFAKHLAPSKIFGFVISDVVGNDISTIASGPLSPDTSTYHDALKIINQYRVTVPGIKQYLMRGSKGKSEETPKRKDPIFDKVQLRIIADHHTAADIAEQYARSKGLRVIRVKKLITGEARDTAKKLLKLAKPKTVLIASGETTVTCKGDGHGGRNQEFVLASLPYLKSNQSIISIGTDGVDGICPREVAGAVADSETAIAAKSKGVSIKDYLDRNDSYAFFRKMSGHVVTGKTGTNVGDLVMILSE